jgi:hypothetical protein
VADYELEMDLDSIQDSEYEDGPKEELEEEAEAGRDGVFFGSGLGRYKTIL